MSLFEVFYFGGAGWIAFFLIMKIFEHVLQDQFYEALERLNLSISLGYLKWETTCFNACFEYVGKKFRRFLSVWFFLGVCFGFFAFIVSVLLLFFNLVWLFFAQSPDILTPVIPGINVPTSQLGYYFFSLFLNGVFHEFGHAIATIREKRKVNSFGVFLLFIYPGAFVNLKNEGFSTMSNLQLLKIYCAGAWHNFVLSTMSIFLIFLLPILLSPVFIAQDGAVITQVPQDMSNLGM